MVVPRPQRCQPMPGSIVDASDVFGSKPDQASAAGKAAGSSSPIVKRSNAWSALFQDTGTVIFTVRCDDRQVRAVTIWQTFLPGAVAMAGWHYRGGQHQLISRTRLHLSPGSTFAESVRRCKEYRALTFWRSTHSRATSNRSTISIAGAAVSLTRARGGEAAEYR